MDYNKQSVRINNFNVTQNVLNLFGDMVQFINISFIDINAVKGNEIGGSITAHAIESLKELHLRNCHGSVLDAMNRPFPNVTIASFSTHSTDRFEIGSNTLKLDRMFPNLQRLHVKIANVDDLKFVGDEFSELRSLIVDLPEPRTLAIADIEFLFRGSSSINTLTIHRSSLKLLKSASRLLSKLKVLRIFDFSNDLYQGNQIQFKNVYHLYITSTRSDAQIPEKLVFHQLRKLSLNLDFGFTDQWIQFFGNQVSKSVEVFEIKANAFTKDQLLAVAEHLPNIKVASIMTEKKVSAETIINFLATSKQLFILQIQMALIDVAERKQLYETLQHEWDISSNYPSINVIAFTLSR